MNYAYPQILIIQCMTVAAIAFLRLGETWIDGGSGFRPMAAGVLFAVLITAPYLVANKLGGISED